MLADYTIFKAFTQTGEYTFHTQQTEKYQALFQFQTTFEPSSAATQSINV